MGCAEWTYKGTLGGLQVTSAGCVPTYTHMMNGLMPCVVLAAPGLRGGGNAWINSWGGPVNALCMGLRVGATLDPPKLPYVRTTYVHFTVPRLTPNIVVYYVACDAYSYGTTLLLCSTYLLCMRVNDSTGSWASSVHNQRGCGPSQCTPHMLRHRVACHIHQGPA